jgi:hypothetical protein
MPRLEPVGVIPEDERQFDALVVPIVGYTKAGEEVVTDVMFRPLMPIGDTIDLILQQDEHGLIPVRSAIEFVTLAVEPDARDQWDELIHSPDLLIEQDTIVAVYRALMDYYTADRPTRQRSALPPSSPTPRRTTRAAARNGASTSTRSRSGARSTSSTRSRSTTR